MQGKRILLAVGGGIAAYKTPELVRHLRLGQAEIVPVLTANAHRFVTPTSLQAVAGRPVLTDIWDAESDDGMGHIELARWADVMVIAPATANLMARMAAGIADDLVTAIWLATRARTLMAPAMNTKMWEHPATRRNLAALEDMGVTVLGPDVGEQACGEFGPGRMVAPAEIARETLAVAGHAPIESLAGVHVLVTAGPTREPIDPVRFISNRSSGRQGFAMAAAAQRSGASVTLVAGPVSLGTPPGVERVDVTTAAQMKEAVLDRLGATDILIAVAAVADYRPAEVHGQKIKKSRLAGEVPSLTLTENDDIIACAAAANPGAYRVGFAAETETPIPHAREKRTRKQLDAIIVNDVSDDAIGFDSDNNAVTLIHDDGEMTLPKASKDAIATSLVHEIANLFAAREQSPA